MFVIGLFTFIISLAVFLIISQEEYKKTKEKHGNLLKMLMILGVFLFVLDVYYVNQNAYWQVKETYKSNVYEDIQFDEVKKIKIWEFRPDHRIFITNSSKRKIEIKTID